MTQQTKTLPQWARNELKQAAQTPITVRDPYARVKAVDRATERIRTLLPHCFQPEPAHEPASDHE